MMRWFGRDFGAPLYNVCAAGAAPVGTPCRRCSEEIVAGDDGFVDAGGSVFHRACFLRMIYGSINHQLKLCSCFHELGEDDEEFESNTDLRREAEAAVRFFERSKPRLRALKSEAQDA
jgi:hypothetical protein